MIRKVDLVTFQVAPSDRLSRVRVLLGASVAKTAFLLVFAFLKSEKLHSYICFRHSSRPNLLISLFISFLLPRAYENKTDGIYYNRCSSSEIFTFSNIRYGIGYMGKAVGTVICGFTFELGLGYVFAIAIIFIAMQIGMALYLVKLRKWEEKSKNAIPDLETQKILAQQTAGEKVGDENVAESK